MHIFITDDKKKKILQSCSQKLIKYLENHLEAHPGIEVLSFKNRFQVCIGINIENINFIRPHTSKVYSIAIHNPPIANLIELKPQVKGFYYVFIF